ncbi:MAG: hypothetical protein JST00_36165 [Deltaproteobacteria bacterium]|nr:hypothetical protein [Deltaproteobacteria bacterium]
MGLRLLTAAVVAAGVIGCGGAGEGVGPAADGAPAKAPDPVVSPGEGAREASTQGAFWVDDGTRATKPLAQFSCRKDAFCDDFEGKVLPGSLWSVVPAGATNDTLAFVGPSSSLGARALRVSTGANGAPSFLEVAGKKPASGWAGAFGVSIRVDALPEESLAGPEILVRDDAGVALARIAIVVTSVGIGLEQRGAGCEATACAERLDMLLPAIAGDWHRVVVGVEAVDAEAPPYGRVEVSIDGSDNAAVPLALRSVGGRISVAAGITRADVAPAVLRVDDVMFFTR